MNNSSFKVLIKWVFHAQFAKKPKLTMMSSYKRLIIFDKAWPPMLLFQWFRTVRKYHDANSTM